MDGITLLREAREAGLRVSTTGDKLVVRGLKTLEPLAKRLLAAKPIIVAALQAEKATPPVISSVDRELLKITFGADRRHRDPDACPRCGHRQYTDVAIHDGRSSRRDCAKCGHFVAFTTWYGRLLRPGAN